MNVRKSDIYGIVGSALFCGVVVLLLVLIAMPGQPVPEDEGIVVSFGTSFEGGGQQVAQAVPAPQPQPEAPQPAAPQPAPQPAEEMLTQESPSVAMQEQQNKEAEEAARLAEEQRLREEEEARLAEERRIAEQKRREQEAIKRAQSTVGGAFNKTVTPEGSGTGESDARQGNPVGQGSSEGHSWSLDGRALMGKLLDPLYEVNVEGQVTVSIRVDENGNVVGVSIGRPTDISDAAILTATLDAARKAKFSAGKNVAVGTITYNFRFTKE